MNFVALDFETSDFRTDSACSIGLVRVENGIIVSEFSRLIKPPQTYVRFTEVHGLRWNDLCDQTTFDVVWAEELPFFKGIDFIAAHNASFDRGVLKGCCARYNLEFPEKIPFKCSLQVSRSQLRISPGKLSNVCKVLGIELNHHEALSDARACAKIILHASRLEMSAENHSPL